MSDAHSPSLLARWSRARRATPRAQDPADMGTAFGLEYSLDQGAANANDPAGQAPVDPGWLQRWLSRKTVG